MKFIDTLKQKLENVADSMSFTFPTSMSSEDIDLLAMMCTECRPVRLKRGLITNVYAYYIPSYEEYLPIAKSIFNKNGIKPHVHTSQMLNPEGQEVLRVNYKLCTDNNVLVDIMSKIQQRRNDLWMPNCANERFRLNEKISELKKQYQK